MGKKKPKFKMTVDKSTLPKGGPIGEIEIEIAPIMPILPPDIEIEVDTVAFKKEIDEFIDPALIEDMAEEEMNALMEKLKQDVGKALDKAIMSPIWAWRDGTRDIYDTGRLMSSKLIIVTPLALTVSYSVPYANIIHNGGYIQPYGNPAARPVYLPARPWITAVLDGFGPMEGFDFEGFFIRELA